MQRMNKYGRRNADSLPTLYVLYMAAGAAAVPVGLVYATITVRGWERWWTILLVLVSAVAPALMMWGYLESQLGSQSDDLTPAFGSLRGIRSVLTSVLLPLVAVSVILWLASRESHPQASGTEFIMLGFLVHVLAAIVAEVIIESVSALRAEAPPGFSKRVLTRLLRTRTLAYIAGIVIVLTLSDLTPIRIGETVRVLFLGLPKQEQMVTEALQTYDRGDFQGAILRAREVIQEYEPSARAYQQALAGKGAEKWPTGKVPFGRIWKSMEVFGQGSLNSVALAWWIVGRSEQKLEHGCEAKRAFEAAATYDYARSWDPQFWPIRGWSPFGWFWSPPDDARYREQSVVCQNQN